MAKSENKYVAKTPEKKEFFGLGRVIALDDPVNKLGIMGTLISAIVIMIYKSVSGTATGDTLADGVSYAFGFFFAFMLAQELDPEPKRRLAGVIAGVLTVVAQLALGVGDVTVMIWLLFVVRMFNRSSGSRHKIGDNVIIILTAFWMGRSGLWLFPVITGVLYVVESQLQAGYPRSLYLAGVAFASCVFVQQNPDRAVLSLSYVYILGMSFILFLPEITMARLSTARGDKDGKPLLRQRIQMSQALFMLATFFLAWFEGDKAAISLVPAWMAAAGCGGYLLATLIQDKMFAEKK